jgi:glycosyltransferase involved in cell wall biosynthesis
VTVDLMFLAKNRLEFTRESLHQLCRNTNWSMVDEFVLYDDGSTDGTLEFLQQQAAELGVELRQTNLGSAVTCGNHFIQRSKADFLAKCDNDAMYPPAWLDISFGIMQQFPELQMLCLENRNIPGEPPYGYQLAMQGDGLFVVRRDIFKGSDLPAVKDVYWGLEQWMIAHKIRTGWVSPSIPVFLLDRLPFEPWISLSRQYEAAGWQRKVIGAVKYYDQQKDSHLWSWCGWNECKSS